MDWLRSLFFKQEMELSLIGLQGCGEDELGERPRDRRVLRRHDPDRGLQHAEGALEHAARLHSTRPPQHRSTSTGLTHTHARNAPPHFRQVTKGAVTIKLWDLGGQPRFRSMWERYCRGVQCIVYVVDAADHDAVEIARTELHELLGKPTLRGIPLLVLGNKADLPNALGVSDLIERLDLKALSNAAGVAREVCCYSISCKLQRNIDITLEWLTKHAKK